ncbi:hypothetical protein CH380_07795 [Leptospira adleri]|uniref:HTH araC/xylS-type domain-containing protein n=1 Tax=Leptospira adleri TaxID=2023186 RepID=A0A2M9YQU1_9LEPT|nr:hypothetical protein CH380_07795 [Leptospira adleri]PJZ63086.1 hypothetical protein CH376_04335 [Leptospira adleri]
MLESFIDSWKNGKRTHVKTNLKFLDATTGLRSDCGDSLIIQESSGFLGWDGVVLEIGSSPEFYPIDIYTPYFYFAMDMGGLRWKTRKNGVDLDLHTEAGQIWMNPPYVPFTHSVREECHFTILAIEEDRLLDATRVLSEREKQSLVFLNTYNVEDSVLKHFIELFVLEMRAKGRNQSSYLESLLTSFAEYFLKNYSNYLDSPDQEISKLSDENIETIKKMILEEISEKIMIEDMAAEIGMSKFHFLREFKKTTGETPYQYVLKLRISEAERLLSVPDYKISKIAYELGFNDQSHFTNAFRKAKGVSPQSYRKSKILQIPGNSLQE